MSDDDPRERARDLRRTMTDAERTLWRHLRAKRLENTKFRRQEPIGDFIVDFVSHGVNLVVEVDGGQHADRQAYDARRTEWLEDQGFTVLRFWNDEVLTETDSVLEAIRRTIVDLE